MKGSHLLGEAILKSKGLRVSKQRLLILNYLQDVRTHPRAEDIYLALLDQEPQISLATVYNTLNSFLEAGIIQELSLGDGSKRYDIDLSLHGHFYCMQCKEIENLPYTDALREAIEDFSEKVEGASLETSEVKLLGTCAKCEQDDAEL